MTAGRNKISYFLQPFFSPLVLKKDCIETYFFVVDDLLLVIYKQVYFLLFFSCFKVLHKQGWHVLPSTKAIARYSQI